MSGRTAVTTCNRWRHALARPWGLRLGGTSLVALLVGISIGNRFCGWEGAIAAEPAAPTPVKSPPVTSTPVTSPANPKLAPDSDPLDLKALQPGNTPAYLVTSASISPTQLTIPSLWWLQEQTSDKDAYGSKLLENWLAYPNDRNRPGRVDLVVNRQFWSLLDYLDRYAFIYAFGKAARDYGYNIRVFDGQATFLGASTCDFSSVNIDALQARILAGHSTASGDTASTPIPTPPTDNIPCNVQLDSTGKSGLRGRSNQLLPGAGSSR